MVKKDKKSKTVEQKARVTAKQNKKAAQKEKKAKSKGADDSDAEDIDLESVLEDYAKKVGRLYVWIPSDQLPKSSHSPSKRNFSRSQRHCATHHLHAHLLHL